MKSFFLRPLPALGLVLALVLAACGGKAMFTVSGTLSGVLYPGMVLTNGSDTINVQANATTFAFGRQIAYGDTYNVVVTTPPLHETCVVGAAADTAGRMAAINASVLCSLTSNTIGGTVTGLTVDGLVLLNGTSGGSVTVAASTTADLPTFTFPAVQFGSSYGVTVLTQPPGLTCRVVSGGTGIMGDVAITNIAVNCVPAGLGG